MQRYEDNIFYLIILLQNCFVGNPKLFDCSWQPSSPEDDTSAYSFFINEKLTTESPLEVAFHTFITQNSIIPIIILLTSSLIRSD
jgi:hypothetical protein